MNAHAIPATPAAREAEVRRQRSARSFARIAAVLCLFGRNACVERMLRGMFGDVAEADGHLFHVDPRDRVNGLQMRRRGYLNPPETWAYKRLVGAGMTAVDLGANIGYFTLLLARAVGPLGRVVAVEPDPDNAALLRRNLADNGYAHAEVVQAAVADHDGQMTLWRDLANFGDHRVRTAAMDRPGVEVPVVRLDGVLAPGTRVDFIKLDVQGAEQAALAGARRVLEDNRGIVVAAEFWGDGIREYGGDPRAMLEELAGMGFSLALLGEPGQAPAPIAGAAALDALAASPKTVDLIACRTPLRLDG